MMELCEAEAADIFSAHGSVVEFKVFEIRLIEKERFSIQKVMKQTFDANSSVEHAHCVLDEDKSDGLIDEI